MSDHLSTEDRIDRALEGLLAPAELEAFQQDVIHDAELRAAYVDRLWLHSTLRTQRETLLDLASEPIRTPDNVVRRWPVAVWAATLAACVTLAA
ncbi:MAG: hypothetical protein WCF18_05670, partial [Chthoniobacteraceae bacterium]